MTTSRATSRIRRPRVVVYVTREHPRSGADELLVFDVVDDPSLEAVVPGGGIEPGETIPEAVAREVREETGLEVRCVRELGTLEQPGRRDPEFRHETHFVQAVPTAPTADEWDHLVAGEGVESGLVRCYWKPILAGMRVWGINRGALLHELLRERVVGYVTRRREGGFDLLTIRYAGHEVEVPAGRLDPGEDHLDGLIREVEEEAGVTGIRVLSMLADAGEFERLYGPGAHRSYAFHAEMDDERDEWEHVIAGTGADSGLTHLCRWVALDDCPPLWGRSDPLVAKLRRSITER